MENCKLPRDVLIEILSRIPVKFLMRFKCVCKFFYTLIKRDSDFMHKHYEISRAKNDDCAVLHFEPYCWPDFNEIYNLVYKESASDEIGSIKLDIPNSITSYVICCDGMLCLILGRGDFTLQYSDATDLIFDFLIWNPFTRETKNLPSVKVPAIKKAVRYGIFGGFGFGFSKNMSVKIVMLWYFEYNIIEIQDSYEIVMVCSQIGDSSWGWRQIEEGPHVPVHSNQSFYLKGRYYWRSGDLKIGRLVWFDFSDENFGIIEFPTRCFVASVTIMNDNIALLSCEGPTVGGLSWEGPKDCVEIWLMSENENDSNIYWHKHASINCTTSIEYCKYWSPPIGIWKLGGRDHLLVCPESNGYRSKEDENDGRYTLYVISIDLVTQEWKSFYLDRYGRTINILSNSDGFVQVCSETQTNNITFRKHYFHLDYVGPYLSVVGYARVFSESLKLL